MTTKNTIFKLKEGYILLEDLESWYSNGLVTLEDHIQVYEDGGRRMGCYTIRNLIEIYGVEFPFRRVPRELISAPDPSNNIPLLSSNPGIILDRLKINYLRRLFIYVNPDELKNEECAWPKLLNSVGIPKRCLGCGKPIPEAPYRLARHIFSEIHLTKLGEVSEEDYEFWLNVLGTEAVNRPNFPLLSFPDDTCGEWCTKEEFNMALMEMRESSKTFGNKYIRKPVDWFCEHCSSPFCHRRFTTDVQAFKHILKKCHRNKINLIAPLEELNFWKNWFNEQKSKLNEKRSLAKGVKAAAITIPFHSVQHPVPSDPSMVTQHDPTMIENLSETQKVETELDIFSTARIPISFPGEQGMPKLPEMGGAKTNLSGKSKKKTVPEVKAQNCSSNTKFQSIPLLLSYSGPNIDRSKIDHLTKLYFEADITVLGDEQGYWTRFLKSMKVPERCTLCNNEQLSKKPFNLAKHILNEKHLSALRGIPDAEYECWVQLLSLCTVPKVELQATEPIATQSVVEASPNNKGLQADEVADKSENALVENTPDVKKPLETVPDDHKTSEKEVQKAPVVVQAAATEKKNFPRTVKNSPEASENPANNSKKIEQVTPATDSSTVTQIATVSTAAQNKPRVPLLDPMLPKETSVSKEKFNEVLDECLDFYKQGRSQFDVGKKSLVTWTCTFCSTPTRKVALSNRIDTFLHIVKPEHREKMQFQASAADLNHWMRYLLEINKNTGKSLTGEQKHNAKQEVFKRPANNPRIPLLDVPASQGRLMTQDAFKLRCNKIREQLRVINSSHETSQKLECTCYHCPGRPKIASVNSLMLHIFDGKHRENIMYSAMSSDFDYYEELIKRMASVPKKEPAKKTPVSIVNPIPKLSKNLIECDLPLFLTQQKMARRTDETCIGPTNSQIVYLGRLVQNPQMEPMRFRDYTKCGICNVDISNWEIIKIARHIWSTEHLHALKRTGTQFYINDFKFWTERLVEDNTLLYPPHFLGTILPVLSCLGGLKYMDCNVNSEVFKKFSSQELIMINNLDEQKVHWRAVSLLRTFGGCVYCKKWLVSGMEVVQHYTSEEHFEMVRKMHPVNMIHVNIIMSYVKQCQKGIKPQQPKHSKPTSTNSAPASNVSSPQDETCEAMFKDFSFPLFVTKQEMKPRNDEICVGPPNAYVDFVLTTKPADPGMVWPFMKENTKCKICNIFIPGISILDAALHAFSVEHLYNLHETGTNFYMEDFEWWTTELLNEPAFVHNPTPLTVISHLGGFKMPKYDRRAEGSSVFIRFTREDQELIDRIDEKMIKSISVFLLDLHGVCIYCNKWLLTGVEVIKHYTSMEHFGMIRDKHPVLKEFVDLIIIMAKDCQKSNRKATVQEPSTNLGGFNYLASYDEYQSPFYLTKEKLGSRNGTVCSGPPNQHIDFLRKAKPKDESLLPRATDKWKKCGICNIPMSHWNKLQVIEHAYTVEHLYKRQMTGTPLYSEDFDDMIDYLCVQLGRIGHECSSNCTTSTYLGGLRPMSSNGSEVFLEFSPEEKTMLENLDEKKVESQALSLLENFGGCIYCNQWFVSGQEVIEHFTSEPHFTNIRKKEPVKRSYVNCMMEYVKRCQKDSSSCSVM
ncbi:unnamed protein product [Caenorhabditis brenneri]